MSWNPLKGRGTKIGPGYPVPYSVLDLFSWLNSDMAEFHPLKLVTFLETDRPGSKISPQTAHRSQYSSRNVDGYGVDQYSWPQNDHG